MNCCFTASAQDFLNMSSVQWLNEMVDNYKILCGEAPSQEQILAWNDCHTKIEPFVKK